MTEPDLQSTVTEAAERLEVPGVAVGVYSGGREHYAFHGITSVENPLPVDEHTLFQQGSTGKTFTATAMLRLVEQGQVDLDAPVRTYVPELRLKDEDVARSVTVLQLFNHTAGWDGDLFDDTGEGDDALAKYVELMAGLDQVTPLGSTVSYNNASLSLAGRIIEKVTGKTYERAIKELLFDPLGLEHSFFFPNEIMTRRFATGHEQRPDGTVVVMRPWAMARSGNPMGGIASNAADLIAWARFHLGDGIAPGGTRILSEEMLKRMQQPTVESPGSAIGDAVGISWLLSDVDGVRIVEHGGDSLGQHSRFVLIPERDFAVATFTNCGPNGGEFNDEVVRWAQEAYAGVVERDPEPVALEEGELARFAGRFETIAAWCIVTPESGGLVVEAHIKPETLAKLVEEGQEAPEDPPPFRIGMLPGPGDRYVVVEGPAKGMKGYFVRGANGNIEAVHLGGRLATRTEVPAPAP